MYLKDFRIDDKNYLEIIVDESIYKSLISFILKFLYVIKANKILLEIENLLI
ncbi:MAG: hypothetical protein KatS3mg068_2055 [Candidatus Sericytochromatia bacterium]|nr:MAG: hypothetical protein KatS3mg068_2055 [Candidatus Sericytochromatia bacterium]